jgi:hypothetical protein
MDRRKIFSDLNIVTLNDITNDEIDMLYLCHKEELNPLSKNNVLLSFINAILVQNGHKTIAKLEDFMEVRKEQLAFKNISSEIYKKIATTFQFNIKVDGNTEINGITCVKNCMQKIENYIFIKSYKDTYDSGIGKNIRVVIYTIFKNLNFF